MVVVKTKLAEEIAKPCAAVTFGSAEEARPFLFFALRQRPVSKEIEISFIRRENSSEISVSASGEIA